MQRAYNRWIPATATTNRGYSCLKKSLNFRAVDLLQKAIWPLRVCVEELTYWYIGKRWRWRWHHIYSTCWWFSKLALHGYILQCLPSYLICLGNRLVKHISIQRLKRLFYSVDVDEFKAYIPSFTQTCQSWHALKLPIETLDGRLAITIRWFKIHLVNWWIIEDPSIRKYSKHSKAIEQVFILCCWFAWFESRFLTGKESAVITGSGTV